MLPVLYIAQAAMSFKTGLAEKKQIGLNAAVAAQNYRTRVDNMLAVGQANALRESKIGTQQIAELESGYARSGVEMTGDVAAYLSEVKAVQERDAQQRYQDMFYNISVLGVQNENMQIAAENAQDTAMMAAISGAVAGGTGAYESYSENANYWDRFGAAANSLPKPTASSAAARTYPTPPSVPSIMEFN